MKKIVSFLVVFHLLLTSHTTFATFDETLVNDPIFMEKVYSFILSEDLVDITYMSAEDNLKFCAQTYLEATRRRDYTDEELTKCWEYFELKNKEEIAYKQYMLNNRELFQ